AWPPCVGGDGAAPDQAALVHRAGLRRRRHRAVRLHRCRPRRRLRPGPLSGIARLAGTRVRHPRLRADAAARAGACRADCGVALNPPFPDRPAGPAGPALRRHCMFTTVPNPIPARMKGLNRAEICDANFQEFVRGWNGRADAKPADDEAVLDGSALDARGFRELFESQLVSRHLDLMARVLRVQNKVFYTIGSSGHEGNAMVARLTRHTDPAFLHYRSGGFMAERFRKLPGMDPVMDSALSFAASKDDPASGGRHKVWGSKPLWVL